MTSPDDLRAEVAVLAARVRALEDREEIARLAARYGPAVDVGDPERAAALWTEDGVYAAPPYAVWTGREEIAGMVAGGHQDLIRRGAGHVLTPLHVELDGDEARGWNHALNVQWRPEEGHFVVFRLSANEWDFRRGPDGWRVTSRVNRPLDGAEEARELFRGSAEAGRG
ncbi:MULTISPECIES: nuclear transport factor 2 family protein [unclassified Blastococcus]